MSLLGIGSLVGAGAGLLGGLFGSGGGISKKEQRNNMRYALDILNTLRQQQEASGARRGLMSAAENFAQDYQTYTPEFTEGLKARYAEDAQNAAKGFLGQATERAGARGTYRDSSARSAERDIGLRLGSDIAQGNRTVDEQARKSRGTDLAQLGSIIAAIEQMQLAPTMATANALLGTPVTQQMNPFGSLLQGLGTISSAIGTAPQRGGGSIWGNMFGGGGGGGGSGGGLPSGWMLPPGMLGFGG